MDIVTAFAEGAECYVHTLTSQDREFMPQPKQVSEFFILLEQRSATPLRSTFTIAKPSSGGFRRTGTFGGDTMVLPIERRRPVKVQNAAEIIEASAGAPDYTAAASGQGPAILRPFDLTTTDGHPFEDEYGYTIRCCVRPSPMATSQSDPEILARFWIEFEFGKWLLPRMGPRIELLDPRIISVAAECFGITFREGWRTL